MDYHFPQFQKKEFHEFLQLQLLLEKMFHLLMIILFHLEMKYDILQLHHLQQFLYLHQLHLLLLNNLH
jgi:hypothetical protein